MFGALGWGGGFPSLVALLGQSLLPRWPATGGVFAAMILGHWYLVTPKLPEAPLVLFARLLLAIVVLQLVLFVVSVAARRRLRRRAVRAADRAVGAVRLAAPARRAGLPAGRVVGRDPDRPDPLDGVRDRAAVHQRRGRSPPATIVAAGLYFGAGLLV